MGTHATYLITFPRSGNHLMVRLLERMHKLVSEEPFTFCEYYTDCKQVNCQCGAKFRKNHDYAIDPDCRDPQYNEPIPIMSECKYIVMYREDPVEQLEAWYRYVELEKYDIRKCILWCKAKLPYYTAFIKKWVTPQRSNVFVIEYGKFCGEGGLDTLKRTATFLGHNVVESRIQRVLEVEPVGKRNSIEPSTHDLLKMEVICTEKTPIQYMKGKAFLFGLNYGNDESLKLNGCINDVTNMSQFLKAELGIPCELITDDINQKDTTAMGMLNKLYQIAMTTFTEDLDFVWIHYSGHGTSILDRDGDERDGCDEALVPYDVRTVGVIPDDYIQRLFTYFNPKTRVVLVFDCCHSGTIGDVMYSWEGPSNVTIENILCNVPARVITLSGCLDDQTAADAFNVLGDKKYVGAMTSCLLLALKESRTSWTNVFLVIDTLRKKLVERGFPQRPKVCSTHNLAKDAVFIPTV